VAFRQLNRVLGGGVALVLAAAIIVPVVWALLAQTYGPDDGTVVELAGSAAVRTPAGVGYRIQHADGQNGLRTGDVVVAIDGRPVSRSDQPPHQAGERLNYQVERAGQTIDVPVVLHTASWRERIVDQWAIYLLPALLLPISGYVFARRPRERAAQLMLAAGALFVTGMVSSPYGPRVIDLTGGRGQWVFVVAEIANAALWAVLLHFTLVFPQRSRLVVGRRWLIRGVYLLPVVLYGLNLLWDRLVGTSGLAFHLEMLVFSKTAAQVIPPLLVVSLLVAYRRSPTPAVRTRMRWVVISLAGAAFAYFALGQLAESVFGHPLIGYQWLEFLFIGCPIAIAAAVLAHNLFELELIIKRSLLYVALAAPFVCVYAGVLVLLSRALPAHSLFIALVAGGVAALAFRPIHHRVQRTITRLIYGARGNPYELLSQINSAVEDAGPAGVFEQLTTTLLVTLRLSYAAITLFTERGRREVVASAGVPQAEVQTVPLYGGGRPTGELLLAVAAGREPFGRSDQQLLNDLSSHVSRVAAVVMLNSELQASRERLITAREEERRRLHQDLHDGIGPTLASHAMHLELARVVLRDDPDAADELLAKAARSIQEMIAEIRRVVDDLRPRVLGQLGLRSAVEERAQAFNLGHGDGLRVTVDSAGRLDDLPAAAEVAAYRIATEALANAARHSRASRCHITLTGQPETLTVSVRDNGIGMTGAEQPGVGLWSMQERAQELGGSLRVETTRDGGTHILAILPLSARSSGR
jgi:signal transduction histidine kinase